MSILRSQYKFLCFYACVTFSPEEVVAELCVFVFLFFCFLRLIVFILCVTKHSNNITEFQLRGVGLHFKQGTTVCFLVYLYPLLNLCSLVHCFMYCLVNIILKVEKSFRLL